MKYRVELCKIDRLKAGRCITSRLILDIDAGKRENVAGNIAGNVNFISSEYTVGSKYGSDGNYNKNDGFSTRIENETRQNTLFFSTRIQCLSQD
jgi:hypothetical protein